MNMTMDMNMDIPKGPRLESRPHRAGVAPLLPPLDRMKKKRSQKNKQTKHNSHLLSIFQKNKSSVQS
jgi:hypothetical protein